MLCVLAAISASMACSAEPEVAAEINPDRIFLGESVRYRVSLNGGESTAAPKLIGFDDFDVRSLGAGRQMRMSVTINGVTKSSGGFTHEFILTPKRAGDLTVPAPSMDVDGKAYKGPTLGLKVELPPKQDVVVMELSADRDHVYPLQPFTVKLNVAVKSLPDPNGETEPVSVQPQPPRILMPWADDDGLPEGVAGRQPAGDWLRQLLSSGRRPIGFAINNVHARGRSPFADFDDLLSQQGFPDSGSALAVFGDRTAAAFHPEPKRTVREDLRGGRSSYWEYSFERVFTAKKLGKVSFGPATIKGAFAAGLNSRGELSGERVYAVTDPVAIEVRDAPTEGRPDSYVGAVGRFEIGAELNPTQAKVGDPMTFTFWLKGEGTLENASAPQLEQTPVISSMFKVHEGTEETRDGERRFTYSLRPKKAGLKEFPSISVAYFDYSKEQFVTLNTPAIPIEIGESDQLVKDDIAMAASARAIGVSPESRVEGIFANVTDDSQLRNETVRPEQWFLTMGGMAGVFLVMTVVMNQVRKRGSDVAGRRRRTALARARQRWEEAQRLVKSPPNRQAADAFSLAIIGWIADMGHVSEQGLTSGDAVELLRELGYQPSLLTRVTDVLAQCDAARYGAPMVPLTTLNDQTRDLLDDLSKARLVPVR